MVRTRCLFETYLALVAEEATKRKVLEALIHASQRAVPGQGLESLGGALMRKSAENGDSDAAFFLSLIPPTVRTTGPPQREGARWNLSNTPIRRRKFNDRRRFMDRAAPKIGRDQGYGTPEVSTIR